MNLKTKIANTIFQKKINKLGLEGLINGINKDSIKDELTYRINRYYGGCHGIDCKEGLKCEYLELIVVGVYKELCSLVENKKFLQGGN